MTITKTRLNISLSKDVREALGKLARRDRLPQATKAARLLETALELEEDQLWDKLANERDRKRTNYRSHQTAWE